MYRCMSVAIAAIGALFELFLKIFFFYYYELENFLEKRVRIARLKVNGILYVLLLNKLVFFTNEYAF